MQYGLSDKHLRQIIEVLSQYEDIEEAVLFGSRAIGTFRNGSDVDIVIFGENADFNLAAKIKGHLEYDTYLPYFFDVLSYKTIKSEDLKRHIEEYGKLIYRKETKKDVT